jgi:hypothetical protein
LQEVPYLRLLAPKRRLEFLYLQFFTDFSVFSNKSLHSQISTVHGIAPRRLFRVFSEILSSFSVSVFY